MKGPVKATLSSLYGITNPIDKIEKELTSKKIKFDNPHGYEIIINKKTKKEINKIVEKIFPEVSKEALSAYTSVSEQDDKVYIRQIIKI